MNNQKKNKNKLIALALLLPAAAGTVASSYWLLPSKSIGLIGNQDPLGSLRKNNPSFNPNGNYNRYDTFVDPQIINDANAKNFLENFNARLTDELRTKSKDIFASIIKEEDIFGDYKGQLLLLKPPAIFNNEWKVSFKHVTGPNIFANDLVGTLEITLTLEHIKNLFPQSNFIIKLDGFKKFNSSILNTSVVFKNNQSADLQKIIDEITKLPIDGKARNDKLKEFYDFDLGSDNAFLSEIQIEADPTIKNRAIITYKRNQEVVTAQYDSELGITQYTGTKQFSLIDDHYLLGDSREDYISDIKTLNRIKDKDVILNTSNDINKETTVPSVLINPDDTISNTKIKLGEDIGLTPEEIDNFDFEFKNARPNDETGEIVFDIDIVSKKAPSAKKTITNAKIKNLASNESIRKAREYLEELINKITALEPSSSTSSLATKMASEIEQSDLISTNIQPKEGVDDFVLPANHEILYEVIASETANDVDGVVNVLVKIKSSKGEVAKSIPLKGLVTKLSKFTDSTFSVEIDKKLDKTTKTPTDLLDAEGKPDSDKINLKPKNTISDVSDTTETPSKETLTDKDLENYDVTYDTNYVNEKDGKIGVKVTLTSKTDPKNKRVVDNIEINGLKTTEVTETLDPTLVSLKPEFRDTKTLNDIKRELDAIANPKDKATKFKEYFDLNLPDGIDLDEVETLTPSSSSPTSGDLRYKLKKTVRSGTEIDKDATSEIVGPSQEVELTNLANPNTLLNDELNKITSLTIHPTQSTIWDKKFSHEFTNADFTNTNISAKAGTEDYVAPSSYTLTFEQPTPTNASPDGTVDVIVKLEKDGITVNKKMTLPGFKELSKTDLKLKLVDESNKADTLPSDLSSGDTVIPGKINLAPEEGSTLTQSDISSRYNVTYTPLDVNDSEGKAKFNVTLTSKENPEIVKVFEDVEITGLKKEIDTFAKSDIVISMATGHSKDSTLAQDLYNSSISEVENSKLATSITGWNADKLSKYNITYSKAYLNDVTGTAGFNVTFTLRGDQTPTISKTFENVEITGLKPYVVDTSLAMSNFSPIAGSLGSTTVSDLKKLIDAASTPEQKLTKFKEYFNVTAPEGYEVKSISTINTVAGDTTRASVIYVLTKLEVSNGTATNALATAAVDSVPQTIEIDAFPSVESLLNDELNKITTLEINPTKTPTLGTKFPYEFTNTDFTGENIVPKVGTTTYDGVSGGYTLTFEQPTPAKVNNPEGTVEVTVKLEKDGITVTKKMTLPGFKKLTKADLKLNLADDLTKADTLPSDLVVDGNVVSTKLSLTPADGSTLTSDQIKKQYDVTYISKNINNLEGKATFDVVLTPKDSSVPAVKIPNFEITGLKKEIDTLEATGVVLTTTTSHPKAATMAMDLYNTTTNSVESSKLFATFGDWTTEKLSKYDVTYSKAYLNDVTGTAAFNITLTLRDTTISKTFNNIQITGLKVFTISASLSDADFEKNGTAIDSTTANDLKVIINSQVDDSAKVAKIQEYFRINIPADHSLKTVSVEPVLGSATSAVVTYVLTAHDINNGTELNPTTTINIDSTSKTVTINQFTDPSNLVQKHMNNITALDVKSTGTLRSMFAANVTNTDLTLTNLQPKNGAADFVVPTGYTLSFSIPTSDAEINDLNGSMKITAKLEKNGETGKFVTKDFKVNGLKIIAATDLELALASGIMASDTLPSSLVDSTSVKTAMLKTSTKSSIGLDNSKLGNYNISYTKASVEDDLGKAVFNITLAKTIGSEITNVTFNNFEITGLKRNIDTITETNVILNTVTAKSETLAQDLLNATGEIDSSKIILESNGVLDDATKALYDVTYEKLWTNDVEGKVGVNVTLTLKKDSSITKTFDNIEITNLKNYAVTETLNTSDISIKSSAEPLTVNELKTALDDATTQTEKINVLKTKLDITLPAGIELHSIESLEPDAADSTQATFKYKLVKKTVTKGNQTEPDKTEDVVSELLTVSILGFNDSLNLASAELSKIEEVKLSSDSTLATKIPSMIATTDLTTPNLSPKAEGDTDYLAPDGYDVTYDFADPKNSDDHTGEIDVKVTITKDGRSASKVVKVKGLKTKLSSVETATLSLDTTRSVNKASTSPLQLLNSTNRALGDVTKLQVAITGWTNEDLAKYNIVYNKSWINEITGKAGFDVVLSLKSDNTITKTFVDKEITNLKTFVIDKTLATGNFTFKTGKDQTIARELKQALDGATDSSQKLIKFKEIFEISNLDSYEIEIENFELIPIPGKPEDTDPARSGTLTYKLSMNNIKAGTQADKNATQKFTSNSKTVVLDLYDVFSILNTQYYFLKKAQLTADSALANILPSNVTEEQLTTTNIQALHDDGTTLFSPPAGMILAFKPNSKTTLVNDDLLGELWVSAEITIKDVTWTRDIKISGLKTIVKSDLDLQLASGVTKASTSPTDLNASNKGIAAKFTITPATSSTLTSTILSKYNTDIIVENVDLKLGIARYRIRLTSKSSATSTQEFGTYEISGLQKQLDRVTNANLRLDVVNKTTTLASELVNSSDVVQSSKLLLTTTSVETGFNLSDYEVTYTKTSINDDEGKAIFNVILKLKTDKTITKTFNNIEVTGLQPKIQRIAKTDLTIDAATSVTKATTSPSALLETTGEINQDKLMLSSSSITAANYNVSYSKSWINNITGVVGVDVTLTLKSNSAISRRFEDIEITGFKVSELTKSLNTSNFSLKTDKELTTASELKSALDSAATATKTTKFNEYYNISDIDDVEFEFVSFVPITATPATNPSKTGTLTYKLSTTAVPAGTQSNKNATEKLTVTKTVTINTFDVLDVLTANFHLINNLKLTTDSALANILPENVADSQLTTVNIQAKQSDGTTNFVAPKGATISYEFDAAKPERDNLTGSINLIAKLSLKGVVWTKQLILSGLKTITKSDIINIDVPTKNALLPSELRNHSSRAMQFTTTLAVGSTINLDKYNIEYIEVSSNNTLGTATYKVKLIDKITPRISKEIGEYEIIGFEKEINRLAKTNLNVTTISSINKANVLASSMLDDSGNIYASKLTTTTKALSTSLTGFNLSLYNVNYSKSWINEIEGKLGINVTLTLKTNSAITKTFDDLEITGFKNLTIEKNLLTANFTLKSSKTETLARELKTALDAATTTAAKTAKFQEYFNIANLDGLGFEFVNFVPIPVPTKSEETDPAHTGTLTYKLTKDAIAFGSSSDKTATNKLISADKTIVINLYNPVLVLTENFPKVIELAVKAGTALANVSPSNVTGAQLLASNIQPKIKTGDFIPPTGMTISYAPSVTDTYKDDFLGEMKVTFKLSYKGVVWTKELTLKGLKSISKNDLILDVINKNTKLTTEIKIGNKGKNADFNLTASPSSSVSIADIESKYDIEFIETSSKVKEGQATYNVVLISKTNSTIRKTFTGFEITGLDFPLNRLEKTDLALATKDITKSNTLASELLSGTRVLSDKLLLSTTKSGFNLNDYNIEYNSLEIDNVEGKAKFMVTLSLKSNPTISKNFINLEIVELEKELDRLNKTNLTLSASPTAYYEYNWASTFKTNTTSKTVLNINDLAWTFDKSKYNVTHSQNWSNDFDGTAGFSVTFTSKTNPAITKTFDRFDISGFLRVNIDSEELTEENFRVRSGKESVTILQFRRDFSYAPTAEAKLDVFKKQFNITIPTGFELSEISKVDGNYAGEEITFVYKLAKLNVSKGSWVTPDLTDTLISGTSKTLTLATFVNVSRRETKAILDKITALEVIAGSKLSRESAYYNLPSAPGIGPEILAESVKAKEGTINFVVPTGYSLKYSLPASSFVKANDHEGSMNVQISIEKDGIRESKVSKILPLNRLQRIIDLFNKDNIIVDTISSINKTRVLASSLLTGADNQIDKSKIAIRADSPIIKDEQFQEYDFEYERAYVNDYSRDALVSVGSIGMRVIAVYKKNPTIRKQISDTLFKITGFKIDYIPYAEFNWQPSNVYLRPAYRLGRYNRDSFIASLNHRVQTLNDQAAAWRFLYSLIDFPEGFNTSGGLYLHNIAVRKGYADDSIILRYVIAKDVWVGSESNQLDEKVIRYGGALIKEQELNGF